MACDIVPSTASSFKPFIPVENICWKYAAISCVICSSSKKIFPSTSSRTEILFHAVLPFATAWKNPEFLSPAISHIILLRCLHNSSSALYEIKSSLFILDISVSLPAGSVIAVLRSDLSLSMVSLLFLDCCLLHAEIAFLQANSRSCTESVQ